MTSKPFLHPLRAVVISLFSLAVASCSGDGEAPPLGADSRHALGGGDGDGYTWRPMTSPTDQTLWGAWGSADEVIAVGNLGTAAHLVAEPWRTQDTGTYDDLCDVWVDGDSRAFAVGLGGTILRYDDGVWSPMASGTSSNLFDVFGFDDGSAVVVGQGGTILRFDGSAWSPMASVTDVNLFGVWGSAPDDLFAVGVGGTIVHYNGEAWSFMTTVTTENLSAVYGNAADDVWAVGDDGVIIHFDGSAWQASTCAATANFADVWTTPGELWAVGSNGTIVRRNLSTTSCAVVASGTQATLLGVWGRSECEIYAVGALGTILRYGPDDDDDVQTYLCHDHPQGLLSPPTYGLRIDDLIADGGYTFSFDYSDGAETARVLLTYDEARGEIRIQGRAYGGKVQGGAWSPAASGWIDFDFRYTESVAVYDDCGRAPGDDLYVTGASALNTGTVTLDGWGEDASFTFIDRADETGCSFVFDNDRDSKGVDAIADDPTVWSASGWLQPGTSGSRDWLFIATRLTPPTECE
jgi:hypothetical protein